MAAQRLAYGKTLVHSGPMYDSMKVQDNKALISFTHIGRGLVAKGNPATLKGFAIAGKNRKFVWAEAKIVADKIMVWSPEVENPVAVRYAWADNPDQANLYNKDDLPAFPFRTDNWPGLSEPETK